MLIEALSCVAPEIVCGWRIEKKESRVRFARNLLFLAHFLINLI